MKQLVHAVTVLAFVAVSGAGADQESVLAKKIDAEIDAARSTHESLEALRKGLTQWDAEMNRVYGALKLRLSPEAWKALQASQRKWIEMRDTHVRFLTQFYGEYQGTMYGPMRERAIMDVTRQRTLELSHQLDVLEEFGPPEAR